MRELGRLWDRDRDLAKETARAAAYIIGASPARTASTSASRRCSTSTTVEAA